MVKKEQPSESRVTRITASGSKKPKDAKATKKSSAASKKAQLQETSKKGFIRSFFGYFSGAWHELKQVRWPNRKATWGLTAAVLAFSGFFVIFILLLDAGFKYLFEQLLK